MKLKKDGYEVEGTPLEIKEFIDGDNTTIEIKTPMKRLKQKNKLWTDKDSNYVMDNWIFSGTGRSKKSRKAKKNNKKIAKKIGRTFQACKAYINYIKNN